jgi:exosortase/archaeosortase family protein
MTRNEWFTVIFFLGCANGIAARAIWTVQDSGWLHAVIGLFGVSAIVLVACGAGLWLTLDRGKQPLTSIDLAVGGGALAMIALPIGGLSWIAVSGLALYVLLFADAEPAMRRGAVILLATTVPMLWSRLLFQFFEHFILEIDASLVGWLLGTQRTGNMVWFANGGGYLAILPACSSLANMSLAFLCWVTVSELAGHRRFGRDLLWCLLACGSVITINVGRMSLMGISLQFYETIHSPFGDSVVGALILAVTLGWSLLGARRELFPRV